MSAVVFCTHKAACAESATTLRFAAVSLADAESMAVGQSPDVEAARAGVDAAAASLAQARDTNGLSALVGYTELPQSSGVPNNTWSQRIGLYELQATLGDVDAQSPLVAQASAALRGAATDELVAERTERLKVIGLYFTAIQARADLQAKRDAIRRAEAFEDDERAQFSAAKVPYLDLLRAEVALSKARADDAAAAAVDANSADGLAREIGWHAADLRDTVSETVPEPDVIDPDRAVTRAFAQRPELRSAAQGVRAAQAGLAAARRAVIPPITVAGGYARGVDAGTVIGGPVVSASIQIPLSGISTARIAAQQAALRTALARERGVGRALALEVGAAAHTAIATILARDETDAALEEATSTLTFASMEYQARRTSGLSVSDARAIYEQAVIDDIAAQYAALQAHAILDVELSP
jgi:outer membrane protein TolC